MENKLYNISFKKIALTNKVTVTDATGSLVSYSHQKLLKLKERILFYADQEQTQQIAEVNADSVIDFNVKMTLTDMSGQPQLVLIRHGKASIWKANYEIQTPDGQLIARVNEKNPWVKMANGIFQQIPIIGLLAGYVFNAEYLVRDANDQTMFDIKKDRALLESNYSLMSGTQQSADLPMIQMITVMLMRERLRS